VDTKQEKTKPRQFTLRRKLAFSAFSVVFVLLILEGIAHLLVKPQDIAVYQEHEQMIQVLGLPDLNATMEPEPFLFWRLRDNLQKRRITGSIRDHKIDFTVTTHNHLRSPPLSPTKKRPRILAIGDSCTFGLGVNDNETWPAQLQKILNREKIDAEVVNAGVPGYTAFQGKRFLESEGLQLEPDLVTVSFGFNERDYWASQSDFETAAILGKTHWEVQLTRSRLYTLLRRNLQPAAKRTTDGGNTRPRLTAKEFYLTLSEIGAMCRERDIKVLFLVWPTASQIDARLPIHNDYQSSVLFLSQEEQFDVVNLAEGFLKVDKPLFIDHVHANAQGCRIAASSVAEGVRSLLEKPKGAESISLPME